MKHIVFVMIALATFAVAPAYGMTTMMPHAPRFGASLAADGTAPWHMSGLPALPMDQRVPLQNYQLLVPAFAPTFAPNPAAAHPHVRHSRRSLFMTALHVVPFVIRTAIGYHVAGPASLAPLATGFVLGRLLKEPATTTTVSAYAPSASQIEEMAQLTIKNKELREEIGMLAPDLEVPPPPAINIPYIPTTAPVTAEHHRHQLLKSRARRVIPVVAQAAIGFAIAGPFGLCSVLVPEGLTFVRARQQRAIMNGFQKLASTRIAIAENQLKLENIQLRKQLNMVKLTILLDLQGEQENSQ